tara:strand:- start:125 stop:511 length:387 start_codon:yes stop_codon:yes gene_type:complete
MFVDCETFAECFTKYKQNTERGNSKMNFSKLSKDYADNFAYVGEVKKDHNRKPTRFPLGYRPQPHTAGDHTTAHFYSPASDKQGYVKTLETKKGRKNSAVIVYKPLDPQGLKADNRLYNELVIQDGEL